MRAVRIALAAGAILLVVGLGVALTRAPPTVIRASFVSKQGLYYSDGPFEACQDNELLPRGTTAVRLALDASLGPWVKVAAMEGSRVVAQGDGGSGWQVREVTVPIRPAPTRSLTVKLCISWVLRGSEGVTVAGEPTKPSLAARVGGGLTLMGRFGVEDLGPGRDSWLSLALPVARHMGLGRAWSGSWIVVLAAVLMGIVGALSARLLLRELP